MTCHAAPLEAVERIESRLQEIEGGHVFEFLARNPGSTAGEIARGLGCGQAAISAQLYRGEGRRYSARAGRWYPVPGEPVVRTT